MPSTIKGRGLFVFADLPLPGGLPTYQLGYQIQLKSDLFTPTRLMRIYVRHRADTCYAGVGMGSRVRCRPQCSCYNFLQEADEHGN
jgi:uncharacterized Fe-S cluster-containing radical SAM superfamily protein